MNQPTPQTVGEYLEERARNQQHVFYGDLVAHFGMTPLTEFWSAHPLSEIFEYLDQEDAMNNRPFRTAVVITREGNMPGDGFFEALERLKEIADPHDDRRIDVFNRELKEAFAYPWDRADREL